MSRQNDPRNSVKYTLISDAVDELHAFGPMTLEDLCAHLQVDLATFRKSRYSLAGRLALEDKDVIIPRPIAAEGYVYKLAERWRAGTAEDGDPNIQGATSDMVTRVATIFDDLSRLCDKVSGKTGIGKALRKLRRAMDNALDRAEDAALVAQTPISDWAQYVLDNRP